VGPLLPFDELPQQRLLLLRGLHAHGRVLLQKLLELPLQFRRRGGLRGSVLGEPIFGALEPLQARHNRRDVGIAPLRMTRRLAEIIQNRALTNLATRL
jgi:hypothetical protein